MDLYEAVARWIGWPAVSAILLLGGALAYFHVRNLFKLQKDKIKWFEQQVASTQDYRPDVLAQRLVERLRILVQEIDRLGEDQQARALVIRQKEIEISHVKIEIEDLTNQLTRIKDILKVISDRELVCPYCGSPLVSHEINPGSQTYQGREVKLEHESTTYECGFEIKDGIITNQCPHMSPDDFPK